MLEAGIRNTEYGNPRAGLVADRYPPLGITASDRAEAFAGNRTHRRASARFRVSQIRRGVWLTVQHFTVSCIDAASAGLVRPTQLGLAATAFRILDPGFRASGLYPPVPTYSAE